MLTLFDGVQLVVFLGLLTLFFKGIGEYLVFVLDPTRAIWINRLVQPGKKNRRLVQAQFQEQTWQQYVGALLIFSAIAGLATFLLLHFQSHFPLNPQNFPDVPFALAINTAISFLTNTDWQAYAGEGTLSYFSQMMALTVQNFFSPAVGLCVAAVLCRSIVREETKTVGNFWIDLLRILFYLLLPLAIILSLFFMQQGTPQNFSPYLNVETFQGGAQQTLVQGPIASQEAIKVLGTNGGGFTYVNSAHPYENPTGVTNFLQAGAFFIIVLGQLYYFGKVTGCRKSIWGVYIAILLFFIAGVVMCTLFEKQGISYFESMGIDTRMGNLEGKEMRFGTFSSCLYAIATTITSCGAVNATQGAFTPLGGLIPLANMQFGKVLFGGIGTGLCNVALLALLINFVIGLLRGRTQLYLGKNVGAFEISMACLALGLFFLSALGLSGAAVSTAAGKAGMSTAGPHSFTEVLYAYTSAAANNGSAITSLRADTSWYNYTLACAMLLGRFGTLLPVLALAGALAKKKRYQERENLFSVQGSTLVILIIGSVIVLGIIVFLPALMLGPIMEVTHIQMGPVSG